MKPTRRKEVIAIQDSEIEGISEGSYTQSSGRRIVGKRRRTITMKEKLGSLIATMEQVLEGMARSYEEAYDDLGLFIIFSLFTC